ncbi:MAG TPA: glycosyltransferase family 2 protein [Anaerolineae bacterium]|nr:glycosyltransferase family 2 protein [Anaerolineae bacterium]
MPSISLVLPAYNEADNIEPVIAEATPALGAITDDYEIIIVDDGSRDETAAVATRSAAADAHVRLVQHTVNQGFGASVFSGFTNAVKDWILYTDADRQFVLSELAGFLPLMDQADLIAGYRAPRRDPFLRVLYGKGWSMLCTVLFGYTVRDVDCGFKLLRRDMVDELAGSIQSRGATFSIEWLVRAKRAGYRFAELPVSHRPRVAGSQTGANIRVITRAFRELWRLRTQLWREGPAKQG